MTDMTPANIAATTSDADARHQSIRDLNDDFRRTLRGGRIVATSGITALGPSWVLSLLERIQSYSTFDDDNDPGHEHDFGSIEIDGLKVFWKIDYYNHDADSGSENPADPKVTLRIMTIMLAEEY